MSNKILISLNTVMLLMLLCRIFFGSRRYAYATKLRTVCTVRIQFIKSFQLCEEDTKRLQDQWQSDFTSLSPVNYEGYLDGKRDE